MSLARVIDSNADTGELWHIKLRNLTAATRILCQIAQQV